MSSDLSAIHAQTSAILEKLYNERGQPDQLNKAFIQEYFKLVKDHLNLDDEAEVAQAPLASGLEEEFIATAKLSHGSLTEFIIPVKKDEFLVSSAPPTKFITGSCQVHGKPHGKGTYTMTLVSNVIHITIKASHSLVTFVSTVNQFHAVAEAGKGVWVKF